MPMRSRDDFQPVAHRHERVLVLASGPSAAIAAGWDAHPGVPVIAVNGAIDTLRFVPDYWFTLDPSEANRARLAQPRPGTYRYLAVDPDHGPGARRERMRHDFHATGAHLLMRRICQNNVRDPRVIHAGNSGRGGLQLALHMVNGLVGARVGVLGVDGTGDDYWHAPGQRSGDLTALPDMVRRIRLYGAEILFGDCPGSRIIGQRKRAPAEVMEWLLA